MQLQKTEKARAELQNGSRTLGQRERTMLILADGKNTVQSINHLFNGEGQRLAQNLIDNGFLAVVAQPQSGLSNLPVPAAHVKPGTPPPVSADNFEGKRSLATTRMFLFDICERMFVQRDRAQADFFREALRNARDRESMLEAARSMINAIEAIAGHERADSISERIAMLLPLQD